MKRAAILLGTIALLAGCASNPPPPPPPVDLNNPLLAPGFLAQAASGDQFEMQSSQLALQMSQSPAVRSFAQTLITDHTRMSADMAAAAQAAHLIPPPAVILPPQQAMLDQLRATAAGPAFDMAFRDAQVSGHQGALALMQNYAANGDVPALRNAASQAVPVIQSHLGMAQSLMVTPPPPPLPPPPPAPTRPGERG